MLLEVVKPSYLPVEATFRGILQEMETVVSEIGRSAK